MLVEGDDTNEPISDTVRGILDGHVVLDRAIAEGGRFPAVDPLRSLSRTAPGCYSPHERELAREARQLMRLHADMAELIRLGAYRSGANAELDRAIAVQPALERILQQDPHERSSVEEAFMALAAALATGREAYQPCGARPNCWPASRSTRWTSRSWPYRNWKRSGGQPRRASGGRARAGPELPAAWTISGGPGGSSRFLAGQFERVGSLRASEQALAAALRPPRPNCGRD